VAGSPDDAAAGNPDIHRAESPPRGIPERPLFARDAISPDASMDFAILVLLAPLFLLGALVSAQALDRRKSRLPMWRAFAALAREHGLALREGVTSPYGLPELHGSLSDRPIDIRTAEGKSSVPIRTVISVSHRLPLTGDVYFSRGTTTGWRVGSPGWTQELLGGSRKEDQVRFTGKKKGEVDRTVHLMTGDALDRIIRIVHANSFYGGAIRVYRLDVHLTGIQTDSRTAEAVVGDLVVLADSLERHSLSRNLRGNLPKAAPEKPLIPRRALDTGLMAVVLVIAAILVILPLVGGGPLEASLSIWGIAGVLALISISRIAASRLGREEKQILAEFAGRAI